MLLVVPREAEGVRLDRFLATALASTEGAPSRSELQRWILQGGVTVDGAVRKPADKLRRGERVAVEPQAPATTSAAPDPTVEFDILYMDDALIVVDKPAGLVVHPAKGHPTGTLVNGLLARGVFDDLGAAGASAPPPEPLPDEDEDDGEVARLRPGIVHRLDKGTSGIMVVGRSARGRAGLKAQFAAQTVEREYVALCVGAVEAATFDTLHGRHPTDRVRFSSRVQTGKRAVTRVRPLERFGASATYVACRLETGRTHQIRVHLADHRTPILGDPLYGRPPKDRLLRAIAIELGRPALHARALGFSHPVTGAPMRFEVEPPADFQRALEELRAMPRDGG